MKFEWDERKNKLNLAKHGISFAEASLIFAGRHLTVIDDRKDYSEVRHISIGSIYDILIVVVVHTDRNNKTRIISARRANSKERRHFNGYFKKQIS